MIFAESGKEYTYDDYMKILISLYYKKKTIISVLEVFGPRFRGTMTFQKLGNAHRPMVECSKCAIIKETSFMVLSFILLDLHDICKIT